MVDFLPDLLAAYFDNKGFIQMAICKCLESRITLNLSMYKKFKAMKLEKASPAMYKEFFKSFFPQVEKLISEEGFMIKVMCNMVEIYFPEVEFSMTFLTSGGSSLIKLQDLRKFVLSGYEAQIEYTESIINMYNSWKKKKSSPKIVQKESNKTSSLPSGQEEGERIEKSPQQTEEGETNCSASDPEVVKTESRLSTQVHYVEQAQRDKIELILNPSMSVRIVIEPLQQELIH